MSEAYRVYVAKYAGSFDLQTVATSRNECRSRTEELYDASWKALKRFGFKVAKMKLMEDQDS